MITTGLNWGATASERTAALPCDALVVADGTQADRAISIAAPPAVVFAWLCQLRVAPYSYDLLDNFGRRSPRRRDPELTNLEVGQQFMTIFRLQSFVHGEQITLRTNRVVVTYAVRRQGSGTRLHARVWFEGPTLIGRLAAAGDVVMMRKQLLTVKALAEREARPHARRVPVAQEDSALVGDSYDYADAFAIELPEGDVRTPEQAFRDAVARSPAVLRLVPIVHRHLLRFQLGAPTSRNHLIGWRIVTSDNEIVRLEAAGPLICGVIIGRRTESSALFTTFVGYVRRTPARVIWSLVGPAHRKVAPYVLELGTRTAHTLGDRPSVAT